MCISFVPFKENEISFVDCENMKSLRVLKLSRNKLTCIHGLAGAENLDVLELSHNSITRIGETRTNARVTCHIRFFSFFLKYIYMYVYAFLLLLGSLTNSLRLPEFLRVFISPPGGSHSPLSSPDFPLRWKRYFYSYKFTLKQEQ